MAMLQRQQNGGGTLADNSPGWHIMQRAVTITPNFVLHPDADPPSKRAGLLRFQCNKGRNFGPRVKTKGSVNSIQAGMYDKSENADEQ